MRIHRTSPQLVGGIGVALLGAVFALSTPTTAFSRASYILPWKNAYPGSQTMANVLAGTGNECQVCHEDSNGGNGWNGYGWKLRELLNTMTLAQAFAAAEPFDSDLDPTQSDNLAEIVANAQPGWTPGPSNTVFFKNGSTQSGQTPPAGILGTLDPSGCSGSVSTYCVSSMTSISSCVAALSSVGVPSAAQPAGFIISTSAVPGGNLGIMYFSDKGPAAIPFGTMGGLVCAKPGFRSAPKPSGGSSGSCNGSYSFSLADIEAKAPSLVVAGTTINAGMWFRDPANPDGFALSNGIEFTLCP